MVKYIRNIESAMGSSFKKISSIEKKNRKTLMRSISAAVDIKKGERLTADMLAIKRPGTGIAPKYLSAMLGTAARRNIRKDELVRFKDVS